MSANMPNADRLIEVFNVVKARRPGPDRDQCLGELCANDPALRTQVISLLEADDKAGQFLQPTPMVASATPQEKAGQRIGRYKLLERIGEGGCGVVYMAEQEQPVRRRVALKVIKLGMDTAHVIARFEAERQALALMEHPNIAKVLDAGATDAGRPFFVMELVRGIKITDYCDQNHLSTRERLELFIHVCQAIQHAHQKGVIHRDIKPSNILVTEQDNMPVPKIIDFGIAKATIGQLTEKTLFTGFVQFIGTPAYMSPEQAQMTALDIDTRADIYSLGVLLYELLTGHTPFDPTELLSAGLDEMRRRIREEEPVRPSTCLSTMMEGELTGAAKQRRIEPPKLIHLLRGDLDWIVMKCLEKDRMRRYETASALAADTHRYLSNEAVVARPPTSWYRFRKSVRRNRLVYVSGAAVAAALLVGLALATGAFMRERAARRQAEIAQKMAGAELSKYEKIAKFFMNSVDPGMWRGKDVTLVRQMLHGMSMRVHKELAGEPIAQGDLWLAFGNGFAGTEDYPNAITNLQMAAQAYQSAPGTQHLRLSRALRRLSRVQGVNHDAVACRSNALLAVHFARESGDPETLASALLDGGKALNDTSQFNDAIPLLRESVQLRRKVVPHMLACIDSTRCLVKALEGIAAMGRQDEAEVILEEELQISPVDGDLRKLRRSFRKNRDAEQARANPPAAEQ